MFGIGGGELIFIIFIALMLFGSDKIPDIARAMGKGMAQLKNATNEIKSEIQFHFVNHINEVLSLALHIDLKDWNEDVLLNDLSKNVIPPFEKSGH